VASLPPAPERGTAPAAKLGATFHNCSKLQLAFYASSFLLLSKLGKIIKSIELNLYPITNTPTVMGGVFVPREPAGSAISLAALSINRLGDRLDEAAAEKHQTENYE